MNTKQLEKFAQNARRHLHEQVGARLARVLSTDSAELRAKAGTIAALEREIERTSRQEVVERVAYTWFNRFCALRYMDVNRYTRVGIVSPAMSAAGETFTQPEVLQEAKQGHIDGRLERFVVRERVMGLLGGSQPSSDPQQEAYRLLLVAACNSYHEPMPFLFEPIDDYSELLMPEDLLSQGSILQGVREALTAEACEDVEVIGWLYQFYISEKKDEVFASKKKVQADEIPAATQLFTPHWIVRYLVENSLGRLWMLNNPGSRLAERMDYYIKPETAVDSGQLSVDSSDSQGEPTNNQQLTTNNYLVVNSPEELRIADPAAGSGHMLTYAFDLLHAIYEEEGYNAVDIPRLIVEKNLYGMEIDERAGALAAFALMMKGREKDRRFLRRGVLPNVCVLKPVRFEEGELAREPWLKGLEGDQKERLLHDLHLFKEADNFGSLLRPELRPKEIAAIRERVAGSRGEGQLDLLAHDRQKRVLQALDQAAYLARKHHVVVANPPYMGGRKMNAALKKFAREGYKASKSDLFAMFIERNIELAKSHGLVGMITMQSWMFLSSFEKLRKKLLDRRTMLTMAHLGARAFDTIGGEVVSTTAFVIERSKNSSYEGSYLRLIDGESEAEKKQAFRYNIPTDDCPLPTDYYLASATDFKKIPGSPIAYWVSDRVREIFDEYPPISSIAKPRQGLATSDNARFLRYWFEVAWNSVGLGMQSRAEAKRSGKKWFPCQKGGSYRKWYGNHEYLINWYNDGNEIIALAAEKYGSPTRTVKNMQFYFREGLTWSTISSSSFAMRYSPWGFISETKGAICFADEKETLLHLLGLTNTKLVNHFLTATSPTLDFHEGPVGRLPVHAEPIEEIVEIARRGIKLSSEDWNSFETSWEFAYTPLVEGYSRISPLAQSYLAVREYWRRQVKELQDLEEKNNNAFLNVFGLANELDSSVLLDDITLGCNPHYRYGSTRLHKGNWASLQQQFPDMTQQLSDISGEMAPDLSEEERLGLEQRLLDDTMREFISYAVGCMFGRYSLDKPGLILANQGETVEDYLKIVGSGQLVVGSGEEGVGSGEEGVTFMPDRDNVIPMLDGDWFPDDISERFKKFLRVTFGEEHYEENLAFVEAAIGRDIRSYFLRDFYDHHVKMYSKRPIYWLFSSPKGSFNALIYMHRYRPDTVSVVLNDYLREFRTKLAARRRHLEQVSVSGASSQREKTQAVKEMDGIDKVLNELREYEDEVLYPLATEQVAIDLDDGVLVNYKKFGKALRRVSGLS